MSINKKTLAKMIEIKCGTPRTVAEIAAAEMIADDFPMNGITTFGQAMAFLDYVNGLTKKA
jgi:hypothetical protein